MYPYDKPRNEHSDVGREMYGFADTRVRLLGHVWQIHMSVFYLFIYLLASMEMVTELGLVVERTCFRGFRSDETSLLIFEALQKHG